MIYEIKSRKFLSAEETSKLIDKYKESLDEEALNILLETNVALIKKVVKDEVLKIKKMDYFDDYLQEAFVQFMLCIKNYDTKNAEASFQTYLVKSIPGRLKKYTNSMEISSLNLRKEVYRKYLRAEKFEEKYIEEHGVAPTIEEKAAHAKVTVKFIEKYTKIFRACIGMKSLNELHNERGSDKAPMELYQCLSDNSMPHSLKVENRLFLEHCFNSLKNEKHKKALYYYHYEGYTLKTISQKLNTSEASARRWVLRAIADIQEEIGVL